MSQGLLPFKVNFVSKPLLIAFTNTKDTPVEL